MKKFLVSIVAMLVAAPSFAQFSSGGFELDKENLYYGVRIGITSASINGDLDLGARVGMTLAGVLGLRVSSTTPVFLESGLYYTERGGKTSPVTVKHNNLEIPLLIKYGIQASDDIAVLPFVGPYFAYAVTSTYKIKGDNADVSGKADLNRANMGFKLGCGFEYNKLYLEVGYQLAVTNILDDDDLSAHNNTLFANFGINF